MFVHYLKLLEKIDAAVRNLENAHAEHIRCKLSCAECCTFPLSFFPVEAAFMAESIREMDGDRREVIRKALKDFGDGQGQSRCPLLVDDRCLGYEARPVLCRTHGLLINTAKQTDDLRVERSCRLNYAEVDMERTDISWTLNQNLLSTLLFQVNGLYVEEMGIDPQTRVLLTGLLEMI